MTKKKHFLDVISENRFIHILLSIILGIISGLGAMPLLWGDRKSCILLLIQGLAILLLLTLLQHFGKTTEQDKNNKQEN